MLKDAWYYDILVILQDHPNNFKTNIQEKCLVLTNIQDQMFHIYKKKRPVHQTFILSSITYYQLSWIKNILEVKSSDVSRAQSLR